MFVHPHSGSTPGVDTLAMMLPAEKEGVVALVKGGSGVGFGETTQLRNGITARALGFDYSGEGSRWTQKALFIGLALLPIFYLLSTVWAWFHRNEIRAKSGVSDLFSLWFPVVNHPCVSGWIVLRLVPNLPGSPLRTISLFQPDLGLALMASPVTGVLWPCSALGWPMSVIPARPDRPVTSAA